MTRKAALGPVLVVALAAVCFGGKPTNRFIITVANKGTVDYLAASGDQLVLVSSRFPGGDTLDRPGSDRWFVEGTRIKSSVGAGYLAYDPTGKTQAVTIVPKPEGEGTTWLVRRPKGIFKPRNRHGSADYEWGVIQVASGPMKDWYLDAIEVTEKRDEGKSQADYRFMVSKEPSRIIEVMRIYR